MATLKAKTLRDSLQKARKVGRVEEAVEIAGCPLVFQSLTTTDYEAIMAECAEFEDMAYYHAYQIGHVARAIVEIDGQDLRDVEFIEDEVPDPKQPGVMTSRKIERNEWIKSNLIASWSREALIVAWRKFAELLVQAERKAKEGIHFIVPDESADDKLRRLLKDARELEEELPSELATKIFSDAGFLRKSSTVELETAAKRVNDLANQDTPSNTEQHTQQPVVASQALPQEPVTVQTLPQEPPQQVQPQVVPAPVPSFVPEEPQVWRDRGFEKQEAQQSSKSTQPLSDPRELMHNRTPLNRQASPIPMPSGSQHQVVPTSAQRRDLVPAAIREGAQQNIQGLRSGVSGATQATLGEVPEPAPPGTRAAQLAALEAQVDPIFDVPNAQPFRQPTAELRSREGLDPRAIAAITEKPPVAGINKKFRPPPKI